MGSDYRNIFVCFECFASPLCPFDVLPSPQIEGNNAVLITPQLITLILWHAGSIPHEVLMHVQQGCDIIFDLKLTWSDQGCAQHFSQALYASPTRPSSLRLGSAHSRALFSAVCQCWA